MTLQTCQVERGMSAHPPLQFRRSEWWSGKVEKESMSPAGPYFLELQTQAAGGRSLAGEEKKSPAEGAWEDGTVLKLLRGEIVRDLARSFLITGGTSSADESAAGGTDGSPLAQTLAEAPGEDADGGADDGATGGQIQVCVGL